MYRLSGGGTDMTQQPVSSLFQGVYVVQGGGAGHCLAAIGDVGQLVEVVANAGKVSP